MLIPIPPGYRAEAIGPALLVASADAATILRAAIESDGTLFAHAGSRTDARRIDSGRGPLAIVPAGSEQWVVRHARRGGAIAPLLRDRYLRYGVPRPIRELCVSDAARRSGIATPRVIAAAVYPERPCFYRGDVITAHVSGGVDLALIVFGSSRLDAGHGKGPSDPAPDIDPTRAARAAGRAIGAAIARGLVHPDLNLKNLLIRPIGDALETWILDLDGCRVSAPVSDRQRQAMRARFERSWHKWERHVGPARASLAAFRAGFAGLPAASPGRAG